MAHSGGMVTPRVVDREQAARICREWQAQGDIVVFTNGCFDLVHVGHVRYLEAARALGKLIVGVNSDESVRHLKGPSRPITPEQDRAELVAALRWVDLVTIFDDPTAERLLLDLKPNIYVKGADYGPAGRSLPESVVAQQIGASVVLIPLVEGRSTSQIIASIRHRGP